ncbi:class I SAM-dependent methyltransferase [Spirosoma taeanense]|uniref:Class I SAM-dependent methyltransferase n=1 Tax=Spirosoma taeanense TaxID=2735870 RepID=A0A6M5Y5D1_9BACT|nr:class I SAM-dependent methyltransferase [Spirosoma taeanense]QJW88303.1 class I SAM-dependent methyltransferase [Spirosoma taeanense]
METTPTPPSTAMQYYDEKIDIYFNNVRRDLIAQLPKQPQQRILEVGSGGGDTLVAIKKEGLATEVVGVELFDMPGTNQQNPAIDQFFIRNIETDMPALPLNYFDVVLCGDVLEHLVDPWKTVRQLTAFLKSGGIIILSCPNIREISTWRKIFLQGDFGYTTSGILDKTHLRFFCRKNLEALGTTDELQPIRSMANYTLTPRRQSLRPFHFGLLDEFLAPQYMVISRKR